MRLVRTAALLSSLIPITLIIVIATILTGCRTRHVDATISNRTSAPITLLEVDYPSASFGTQSLAPGADFHYSFSVIGSGPTKILYTDAANKPQTSTGPTLNESAQGPLTILISSTGVQWQPSATLNAAPSTPQP